VDECKPLAVGTAVLQYDRAKLALGALSERMSAVQHELDHLEGDREAGAHTPSLFGST
jgi:hypothetical protein